MLTETYLPSSTGGRLYTCLWMPDGAPKAVVQLIHGMAEHIHRYDRFAQFLMEHGVAVVGCDLPGHGRSLQEGDTPGYFAPKDGWNRLLDDVHGVLEWAKPQFPGVPYVLMGHGVGSFLVRTYVLRWDKDADAYMISGTSGNNPSLFLGKIMAEEELKGNDPKLPGDKLNDLFARRFNMPFEPARTPWDWRCSNAQQVDDFIADPLCGFTFTIAGFRDLFDGLLAAETQSWEEHGP